MIAQTNKEGIAEYAVTRTFFVFGQLDKDGYIDSKNMELKEIETMCSHIANDWINKVDTMDKEEEKHIQSYAKRKILEQMKSNK